MKIGSFILSFYLILLAGVPCNDDFSGEIDSPASQETHVEVSTAQDQVPHSDDACSPFCACACCQTISITPVVPVVIELPQDSKPLLIPYTSSFYGDIFRSAWKPPQLQA